MPRVSGGAVPELMLAAHVPPEIDEQAAGDDGERLLQVGDIAKASGKTVRAIHHYEEVGLLRPHARSKGRYRLYDQAALARVRWIGKLHDLGLSLAQIQELVHLFETSPSAPGAMGSIRAIYAQKLDETRAQIRHLTALERELEASLSYLDTCDTCDPAELVRACSCCNHHDKTQPEPHLVAGIHAGNGRGPGTTSPG
ncbi:transcriptional activator TipA [Minicystis rosea]|nr:transcriptional activator TipA [Minicystis rosea]